MVLAEHNEQKLTPITANAVSAATKLGGDVTVLVAGANCAGVAEKAAKLKGVTKVLVANNPALKGQTAEAVTDAVVGIQNQVKFTHIVAGATAFGKNVLPRVAAKLDVSPVSDIIGIKSPDTFVRTIYAGNAIQTLKAKDPVKVLTVRGTNFEAAPEGGSAAVENAPEVKVNDSLSQFVGQEITKSDRPELTSASVIVSGGKASNVKPMFP